LNQDDLRVQITTVRRAVPRRCFRAAARNALPVFRTRFHRKTEPGAEFGRVG